MNFDLDNLYEEDVEDPSIYLTSTISPINNNEPLYDVIIRERTTAKDKRRDIVRKSEIKRRKKIKDLMEELKQMVIPNDDIKVSQQEILCEAAKKIRELQAQLEDRSERNGMC
jgi:hypothetical protein